MIEYGKIKISYEKICEILRELDIVLGQNHTTVVKLRDLKEEQEIDSFRSDIVWEIITLKTNENPILLGEFDKFIRHTFPDIDYEPPHEFEEVFNFIRPFLKERYPDFEKYQTAGELVKNVGNSIKVPVIKLGIKENWRKK